jgi:short-subunit dehydrogenase
MRAARGGRIVNIGSMGGTLVFPGGGIYHATKYAVEALSDAMRFEVKGFGVDVVLIQPGLIVTDFAKAAVGALNEGTTEDGPYAEFNRAVAEGTVGAYEGPTSKLGGPPEAVAKVVAKAISTRRPRTRYKVTASAHVVMRQRKLMTDRLWDRFVGTQFPQPG